MNYSPGYEEDVLRRVQEILMSPDDVSLRWLIDMIDADSVRNSAHKSILRVYCAILLGADPAAVISMVPDCFTNSRVPLFDTIRTGRLISRICDGNVDILGICADNLVKSINLNSSEGKITELYCAVGEIHFLMQNPAGASEWFHKALPKCTSLDALLGVIQCKIKMGAVEEARDQFDFIAETQTRSAESPEFLLLQFYWTHDISDLNECLNVHIGRFRSEKEPFDMITAMNPPFMIEIARMYLESKSYARAIKVSETVLKYIPHHRSASLVLAECFWHSGKSEEAKQILSQMGSFSDAVLLNIRILLSESNSALAGSLLEDLPNIDPDVRLIPIFWLCKAKLIISETQEVRQAIHVLVEGSRCSGGSSKDREEIELLLIKAYAESGNFLAAHECLSRCKSSGVDPNILALKTAEVLMVEQRFEEALSQLAAVSPTSTLFKTATDIKIEIFLKHKRDKRNLILAIRESCTGSSSDWERIGDIFVELGEVSEAIKMFEQCPSTQEIKMKIFNCLILGHRYDDALSFCRQESSNKIWLNRLVELLCSVRKFDHAFDAAVEDPDLLLLVCESAYQSTSSRLWAERAVAVLEESVPVSLSRDLRARRYLKSGEWHLRLGNMKFSKAAFENCVKLDSHNEAALLGLVHVLIEIGDPDGQACEFLAQCNDSEKSRELQNRIHSRTTAASFIALPVNLTPEIINSLTGEARMLALYRSGRLSEYTPANDFESAALAFYGNDEVSLTEIFAKNDKCRSETAQKLVLLVARDCMEKRAVSKEHTDKLTLLSIAASEDDFVVKQVVSILCLGRSPPQNTDSLLNIFIAVLSMLIFEKNIGKCKTILKNATKNIFAMKLFSSLDFWLAESLLCLYLELRLERKEAGKALLEAEFISSFSRGSGRGWKLLGRIYDNLSRVDEAVNAFENSLLFLPCEEATELLVEVLYKKKRDFFKVLQLILASPTRSKRMTELCEKSIIKLHSL